MKVWPRPPGNRVEDVGPRIDPRGQAPHHVVHRIGIGVLAHRDGEPHALRAREDGGEEVALPALVDLVALLDLDDGAAPVGHAVGDHHVLDDAGLQPVAQLVDRRLAHRGVDVVVVERVHAEREDDRLRLRLAHGHRGDVEGRRLVGLAHVARPLGVEMEAALNAGVLGLLGLEAAVARIDIAFQHQLGVGDRQGVDGARLDQPDRRALHGAGDADLVAAHRQDGIVEAGAGEQRARRRHAKAHGDRHRLVRLVVLVDHLPHVRAGRDLEGADIAPAEVHAVVAEVGAAIELRTGDAADARPDGQLRLIGGVPDRHHVLVHVLRILDDVFLARRLALRNLDRLERMRERIGELARALDVVLPAEHLVDDVDVAEQVGEHAVVRLALDVVEQHRAAAVEMLLQAGDFEVGVDRLVGLDQVALGLEPFQRAAQVDHRFARGGCLFLADCFLHGRQLRFVSSSHLPACGGEVVQRVLGIWINSASCSLVISVAVNFRATASFTMMSRPMIRSGLSDCRGRSSRERLASASEIFSHSA